MSENCSACGAKRTMFEGQTSWDCGSYQSLLGGSHIKTPQFKLIQSELCKSRVDLATLRAQVAQLTAERDVLAKFKAYTHQRMDELGVPPEVPDSEHTKAGCRIGGRFDWVAVRFAQLKAELTGLRNLIATLRTKLAKGESNGALAAKDAIAAIPADRRWEELRAASVAALKHVEELRDAWMRGSISEHDRLGGVRSSRNVGVEAALRKALDRLACPLTEWRTPNPPRAEE